MTNYVNPIENENFWYSGANAKADITDPSTDSDTLFVKQNKM